MGRRPTSLSVQALLTSSTLNSGASGSLPRRRSPSPSLVDQPHLSHLKTCREAPAILISTQRIFFSAPSGFCLGNETSAAISSRHRDLASNLSLTAISVSEAGPQLQSQSQHRDISSDFFQLCDFRALNPSHSSEVFFQIFLFEAS